MTGQKTGTDNEVIVQEALSNLAENEYFSGVVSMRLWRGIVATALGDEEKLQPAVNEKGTLDASILCHPMHTTILQVYCDFRGREIGREARIYGDTALQKEIQRVSEIHANSTRPVASGNLRKYVLVLLVVIVIAILLGGNGP